MELVHPSHSPVQAIVFDLDGVLIDSEELWDEVRRSLAAEHGLAWIPEATRAMQGMSTPEWAAYLTGTVGIPGTDADVSNLVVSRLAHMYEQRLPLLPGAIEAVAALAEHWPLGLASSSPRRLIEAVLGAAGLADYFAVSVSTEEVEAGKPSPAVYLRATELLGVEPTRTIAVEDSSNGIRAAVDAGLIAVAVPNEAFPPSADALALATATVDRVSEVTPHLVAGLIFRG
ncbi:MAG: HAD family phosphatase [Actinomycetes bacterium]